MFYFTPLTGVLFTFPSQYLFAIGRQSVFSLTGWSRRIHTGFPVPRITWDTHGVQTLSLTGLSPSMVHLFRCLQLTSSHLVLSPTTPMQLALHRFGLFPVHSPLLRESLFCFIFFPVLRCFSSRTYLPQSYVFTLGSPKGGVAPFGDPRILARNGFPRLFAVYYVLLRLLAPRYPPCALCSLTKM